MGLASFNRMRLRRINEMQPEKVEERRRHATVVKEQTNEAAPEEKVETKVTKTEVKRGSKRK